MEEIMILQFSVKNFRSFKEKMTISFEASSDNHLEEYYCHKINNIKILKFGVLYGANASGKTNVLLAMDFLRKAVLTTKEVGNKTGFIPFLFDDNYKNSAGEFDILFYIEKIKYRYFLKIDAVKIYAEKLYFYPKGQPVEVFIRNEQKIKFGSHPEVKMLKKDEDILIGNTVENMTLISALRRSNGNFFVLQDVFDWFLNNFLQIIVHSTDLLPYTLNKMEKSEQCKALLIDLMQKADFNIDDILLKDEEIDVDDRMLKRIENSAKLSSKFKKEVVDSRKLIQSELLFKHKILSENKTKSIELNEDLESEGTMRFFDLGGPLNEVINNDKVLLIDEMENSLHPELVNYYINVFLANSTRSQLIITTQNLNLLADPNEIRQDVIWFTEKMKDGSTDLYSLSDFKSSEIRKGANILKKYKAGKFGAIPNLGSIFLKDQK